MEQEKEVSCCTGRKKHKTAIIIVGILVLGVVLITAILREKIVDPEKRQVVISGEGKVSYQPDIANVSLGVQIDKASTAEQALDQLNKKMEKVIAAVESLGIARKNIQTQNYSLYPAYDYKEGTSVQSGFNASQQVSIKIENIQENSGLLSQVISKASEAGTNQVNGISFDVSSMDDLRQQARLEAIKDAKEKSQEMAKVAEVKIGKLLTFSENMLGDPGIVQPMYAEMARGGGDGKVAPDVPSGTQEIVVQVNVTFEIK